MNEQAFRIAAAAAALAVFAYPFVMPAIASVRGWLSKPAVTDPVKRKMQDLQILLELSSRFSMAGSKEGVDLCQKLIDVLLKPSK